MFKNRPCKTEQKIFCHVATASHRNRSHDTGVIRAPCRLNRAAGTVESAHHVITRGALALGEPSGGV